MALATAISGERQVNSLFLADSDMPQPGPRHCSTLCVQHSQPARPGARGARDVNKSAPKEQLVERALLDTQLRFLQPFIAMEPAVDQGGVSAKSQSAEQKK